MTPLRPFYGRLSFWGGMFVSILILGIPARSLTHREWAQWTFGSGVWWGAGPDDCRLGISRNQDPWASPGSPEFRMRSEWSPVSDIRHANLLPRPLAIWRNNHGFKVHIAWWAGW